MPVLTVWFVAARETQANLNGWIRGYAESRGRSSKGKNHTLRAVDGAGRFTLLPGPGAYVMHYFQAGNLPAFLMPQD